jgi:hypothetical protein
MNCHLLHTILTHVSNLKKTDHCIYIEVKDTTDTKRSALYLFIHACNRQWGENKNKTLWQTQWHHFSKRQLPFHQHSSIPASPAYGVYISQLIGYNISCVQYSEILDRALLQAKQLPKQGYVAPRRKSSVQQLCCVFVLFFSSCVPYIVRFSRLYICFIVPSVFSNVY